MVQQQHEYLVLARAALCSAVVRSNVSLQHPSREALSKALNYLDTAAKEEDPRRREVLLIDAVFWAQEALVAGPGGTKTYRQAMARLLAHLAAASGWSAATLMHTAAEA